MPLTITVQVGPLTRHLPLREIAPGLTIALFNLLGDWELTEAAGTELAKLVPYGTEALVMPDGKAQALLHVLGRETGLPTFVARKEIKPYMTDTVSVAAKSITSQRVQMFHLSADDAAKLEGKSVAIVDDVMSTGAAVQAMTDLLRLTNAKHAGTLVVFTEGSPRPGVISLGHLPVFTGTTGGVVLL